MRDLLVVGYYGNANLGDEAMLAGLLALLRERLPELQVSVASGDPADTESRHGVRAIDRRKVLDEIERHRCFLLGGGDLIRDSVEFAVAQAWLEPLKVAIEKKRRTAIFGISVGEVWKPETQLLVESTVSRADLVAVRDEESRDRLQALGVRRRVDVIGDMALMGVEEPPNRRATRSKRSRIGVALRGLRGRGRSVDVSGAERLRAEAAAIADAVVKDVGSEVHFVPFRSRPAGVHAFDDDYVTSKAVRRAAAAADSLVVHRHLPSLEEMIELICTMDVMIAMRLHAAVLAAAVAVPVIAIEYDPKVRAFMTDLGQRSFSVPLPEFRAERVIPLIHAALARRPILERQLEAATRMLRARTRAVLPSLVHLLMPT